MVAAQHHGDDAAARHLEHPPMDGLAREVPHAGRDERVAVVDDVEVVEDLDLQVKVIRARLIGIGAQRPRAEAGTGPVGRAVVPWCTDDGDIGPPLVEMFRLGQMGREPNVGTPT